ncbi:Methylamine utilization protein MauD [BD1-7 clade bacterium]|uniref:Methylamine utilization protein MauD n=1 Tax=BD1-7 clade bacterium TaxID=2029982 RepID=A0A5S9QF28_9GAMM|nr:Methylamine utilization protein MauD [BD1-7 clade bacterium]
MTTTMMGFAIGFLFFAVMILAAGFWILARQIGVLFERIAPMGALVNDAGPQIGDTTPVFSLPSLTGGSVVIGHDQPKAMLVFFLSPTCPVCKKLLPVLRSIRRSEASWLDLTLASDGELEKHQRFIDHMKLAEFSYVLSTELGLGYRVSRLPFAVLIDRYGVIRAKGLINSREQLESLFNAMELGVDSIQDYLDTSSAQSA